MRKTGSEARFVMCELRYEKEGLSLGLGLGKHGLSEVGRCQAMSKL